MCGIGSITFDKTVSPSTAARLNLAVSELLYSLDHRGGDACGILSVRADGRAHTQKAPLAARDFNAGRLPLPANTRAVAVHTRFATQGSPGWNRNNHPVSANGALVIHNGVIWENLRRKHGEPEVDTYALALAAASIPAKPSESAQERAERVATALAQEEGSAAVCIGYRGWAGLITARLADSPLYVATVAGVRIAASTRDAVLETAKALKLTIPTEPYSYTVIVKKAKKGRPAKTRTATGTRAAITCAEEGTVLCWHAGTHTTGAIKIPEPYRYAKPWSATNPPATIVAPNPYDTTPISTHDDPANWSDATYEAVARRLLGADETYERCDLCDLCDELTQDTTKWHGATACADCRRWYEQDLSVVTGDTHTEDRSPA